MRRKAYTYTSFVSLRTKDVIKIPRSDEQDRKTLKKIRAYADVYSDSSPSSPFATKTALMALSNLGSSSRALVKATVASCLLSFLNKHFPSKKKTFASSGALCVRGSSAEMASSYR